MSNRPLEPLSGERGDPDVVVVGSGPNGLVAACVLAKLGLRVLVLEANPRRPGGALGSAELTLPGFVHDVGAGFFPFAKTSPAFVELDLEGLGVELAHARFESCHPARDGSYACIARDLELSAAHFGTERDGAQFRKLAEWHRGIEKELLLTLLSTFPALGPLARLGPANALRVARLFARSGRRLSESLFQSPAARRVLPALALHVDVGPDDSFGAGLGYMLGLGASTGGYAVVRGGAQSITNALVTLLERHGGRLELGSTVTRVLTRSGRACAVRLSNGEEVRARRAVLADTGAPALLLDLVDRRLVPGALKRKMRRFSYGWGTFKLDYALSRPVPWRVDAARESAVVHSGESIDDLARFTRQARSGKLPDDPYLVIGQHSLVDPSRAPDGKHTLYCYTRVPSVVEGGWARAEPSFAERIERRIEELAPGFRDSILARRVSSPASLEADNANLVGGDLGGGSNAWNHQLLFRPAFPHFRYRMPVVGLYLCSSYAHPGAGVHGMCGYNAARVAAVDIT